MTRKKKKLITKKKQKKGIELKELPIPVTVLKIKNKFILDPTLDEENAMGARLTVTTVEDGRICALQKGGISPLTPEDTEKIIELATKKGKELRKLFK